MAASCFRATAHPRRAVSETTAFLMASMLADVIDAGTANRARALGFKLPAAGKTGTTNDFVDAWFVGFTPSLVAGVWVGFDTPRTIVKNGFAGQLAVPMWTSFMKSGHDGRRRGGSNRRGSRGRRGVPAVRQLAGRGMPPRRLDRARRARSRSSRWCTPTTSCAAPSRSTRAPIHAAEYLPYQEPSSPRRRSTGLAGCLGVDPVVASPPPSPREPARRSCPQRNCLSLASRAGASEAAPPAP